MCCDFSEGYHEHACNTCCMYSTVQCTYDHNRDDSLAVVVSTIILSVTISLHHSKYLYIYKLSRHTQGKSHCSWMFSQSNAYSTSATWLLIFVWCRCATNTANNLTACSRSCNTSSADVLGNHAWPKQHDTHAYNMLVYAMFRERVRSPSIKITIESTTHIHI